VPTAVIYSPDELKPMYHITIDSRRVKKKSLFIAIKGKRFDGHDFVKNAFRKGVGAVLINEKKIANYNDNDMDIPIITVKDTTKALGDIAKIWRKKLDAKVIAITGSSGKTTVKDMLADLLSAKFVVSKTENNNNNNIGVPLTILNTNEKHQILIAELGTNHFGEIPYTSQIISPDYALITNIGKSHIEFLKNKKGVWKEKSSLFDETVKNNGMLFINYDDSFIKEYKVKRLKQVTFSSNPGTDVTGKIKSYTNDGKPIVELKSKSWKISTKLPFYGEHNAKNFIAAASVALNLGITKADLLKGIKKIKMPAGRMNVIRLRNSVLIDDTYNANPDSTKAAIDLVAKIKTQKRKILFLGDMLELGKSEILLHKELAKTIEKTRPDEVYTIGKRMKHLSQKLNHRKIIVKHFNKRNSLLNGIKNMNLKNSVILVKGSRGMHMEEFINAIKSKVNN
jgi:UDP-N-acetylmuramoyl-tripeptide--D-alanyl-D-alanine ligase